MDKVLRANILERLWWHQRAATYGALAGVVGGSAQNVAPDLARNHRNSWVVNQETQRPTGYEPHEVDPNLIPSIQQHGVLGKPEALRSWLATLHEEPPMTGYVHFMRCVSKAVVKMGTRALVGLVLFGDVRCEVAADAYEEYRRDGDEADLEAALEALTQVPAAEVREVAEKISREEAAGQPAAVLEALASYLSQLPDSVRQSLRRPSDSGGTTVLPGFILHHLDELLPLLPADLARFKPGDRPSPGIDVGLEQRLPEMEQQLRASDVMVRRLQETEARLVEMEERLQRIEKQTDEPARHPAAFAAASPAALGAMEQRLREMEQQLRASDAMVRRLEETEARLVETQQRLRASDELERRLADTVEPLGKMEQQLRATEARLVKVQGQLDQEIAERARQEREEAKLREEKLYRQEKKRRQLDPSLTPDLVAAVLSGPSNLRGMVPRKEDLGGIGPPQPPSQSRDNGGSSNEGRTVECAVFAPDKVKQGEAILVQVFAFATGNEAEALAKAEEFDDTTARRGLTTLGVLIRRGQILQFHLSLRGLKVQQPMRELTWQGTTASVQFGLTIPKGRRTGSLLGTVLVSTDGVPVGRIDFKLTIVRRPHRAKSASTISVAHAAGKFRKAFVSYASQDRPKVLDRVQMLRPPLSDIEVFQDILNLEPGEAYESILYRRIDECDLFLLFWSTNARESQGVHREIQRVRQKPGPNGEPPQRLCRSSSKCRRRCPYHRSWPTCTSTTTCLTWR